MRKYKTFTEPYVLVEDATDKLQPLHKQYPKDAPSIDLESPQMCCPFTKARRSEKPRTLNLHKNGFCEICYIRYSDYDAHINSKDHRAYAVDSFHYKAIDEFISEMKTVRAEVHSPSARLEHLTSEYFRLDGDETVIRLSNASEGSSLEMATMLNRAYYNKN